MRVFVAGATGFLGRALVHRLLGRGCSVTAWVRSLQRGLACLGADVELLADSAPETDLQGAIAGCDAVINLAGENVFAGRWSSQRKRRITHSRLETTARLVDAMRSLEEARRPDVFVSASAVGFYGDRGDTPLNEGAEPGGGFLADLCSRWEAAALRAETLGVRAVAARLGIVLGVEGGALSRLLPLFAVGLGGRLGDGTQWVSWIHLADAVDAVVWMVGDPRLRGPVNVTAPEPVRNAELTTALGRSVGRRPFLPTPSLVLRGALGEASSALLGGQRVGPDKLVGAGFTFEHPSLSSALASIVAAYRSVRIDRAAVDDCPDSVRCHGRRLYRLDQITPVMAPRAQLFDFLSRPENLGSLSPASTTVHVERRPPPVRAGVHIDYRVRLGRFPIRWRSRITACEPHHRFIELQELGPYWLWHHERRFVDASPGRLPEQGAFEGATNVVDVVRYRLPWGWLGRLVHFVFVRWQLLRLFAYRREALAMRFGVQRSER